MIIVSLAHHRLVFFFCSSPVYRLLQDSIIKVKNDHRSKFSNLSNWKEEAWKKQGFNGIRTRDLRDTGAMLYQLSYEATHWERGQVIEFISPVRSEMMRSMYEIIHIWTAAMIILHFIYMYRVSIEF